MNEIGTERSKPWNIYTSSDPSPSDDRQVPWKNFGTSMNAISFGFVATAILISMFLIMAIFEHLFRPNSSFSLPEEVVRDASRHAGRVKKLVTPQTISTTYACDLSVMMPGQQYPTYIAQPAPLPCPRERICWPSHQPNFVLP